uniref:G protein-coupled receptor 55a n=1 Tax=Astyanax mexicanus TaxID=7994 RepID=W5LSR8_ASTMX
MSGGGEWVRWLQLSVYVPVLVAGVPLNLATLWKLRSVRRWRESTVYLLNLVISDTLLLFSLPFKIHAYERNWELGRTFCSLLESLVYVNVYGSILLCVCIAADRYVALRFAFAARHLRSPLKASLVCLLIWVLVFSCSYPVYELHHSNATSGNSNGTSDHCFQNFSNVTLNKWKIVVAMETVFCSSALAMVFFSVQVVRVLRELRRRNPGDPKLRNNKSVKIVLSNMLVFLVCFIPYHIAALLYFSYTKGAWQGAGPSLRNFVHSSLCLSSVNCLADGACYYFILKENLHTAKLERRATIHTVHTHGDLGHSFTHRLPGQMPEEDGGVQREKNESKRLHSEEQTMMNFRSLWSKKRSYSFT